MNFRKTISALLVLATSAHAVKPTPSLLERAVKPVTMVLALAERIPGRDIAPPEVYSVAGVPLDRKPGLLPKLTCQSCCRRLELETIDTAPSTIIQSAIQNQCTDFKTDHFDDVAESCQAQHQPLWGLWPYGRGRRDAIECMDAHLAVVEDCHQKCRDVGSRICTRDATDQIDEDEHRLFVKECTNLCMKEKQMHPVFATLPFLKDEARVAAEKAAAEALAEKLAYRKIARSRYSWEKICESWEKNDLALCNIAL